MSRGKLHHNAALLPVTVTTSSYTINSDAASYCHPLNGSTKKEKGFSVESVIPQGRGKHVRTQLQSKHNITNADRGKLHIYTRADYFLRGI